MSFDIRLIFRAFRYRNFRLYFTGQGISQIGSWAQSTALSWYIYRLTGSTVYLGMMGFASQIPTFLIGPFAGVFIDRLPKFKVLVATQLLAMVQAALLALLVLSGQANYSYLFGLAVFQGLITAFDMPARQTLVVELVDRNDERGNAIALNSMMFNVARIIGPSLAGFIIAGFGEGICFMLNGFSFIAVIVTLLLMQHKKVQKLTMQTDFWLRFREGLDFVFKFPPIRAVIILVALNSLICFNYTVLLSAYVKGILGGEAHTLGVLMGCTGIGALLGGTVLGVRQGIKGLGMFIFTCSIIFGLGLIGLSGTKEEVPAMIFLLMTGFGMIGQMASCNTILQTLAGNEMRSRVMSLYTTAYIGMMPIGNIISGGLAARIGVADTYLVSGLFSLVIAAVLLRVLPRLKKLAATRLEDMPL